MPDAYAIRKREDFTKLRALQAKMAGTLDIVSVSGDPPHAIRLRIHIPTAKNAKYPRELQEVSEVEIQLPARYPFPPGPLVHFKTAIWNPNVYTSGRWCFGNWTITEDLALFVIRLMKVIALDPTIINPRSAANVDAARWYVQLHERQPDLFPTVSGSVFMADAETQKVAWRNIK